MGGGARAFRPHLRQLRGAAGLLRRGGSLYPKLSSRQPGTGGHPRRKIPFGGKAHGHYRGGVRNAGRCGPKKLRLRHGGNGIPVRRPRSSGPADGPGGDWAGVHLHRLGRRQAVGKPRRPPGVADAPRPLRQRGLGGLWQPSAGSGRLRGGAAVPPGHLPPGELHPGADRARRPPPAGGKRRRCRPLCLRSGGTGELHRQPGGAGRHYAAAGRGGGNAPGKPSGAGAGDLLGEKRDGGYTGLVKTLDLPPQKHFDDWFVAETAAFLDGIQGARKDLPDLAQGLYIQRVLDAAQAAHDTGHTQEVLL